MTDAGYVPGLTVIRSLGRAGWRVVATHAQKYPKWARSAYVEAWHQTPPPETRPLESAVETARIARLEQVDLVIPTTDKSIYPIDANRHLFEGGPVLALPGSDSLRMARDKDATTTLARQIGIPTPRSVRVENHLEAIKAAEHVGWPVVLKPLISHAPDSAGRITTRSVLHAADKAQLEQAVASPELGGFPLQVQECVEGAGIGVELLVWEGRTVASFQHRRLHEVPLSGGMSSLRVAETPSPALLDHSQQLLSALNWTGVAMVEFKVGADGPRLLEVNGRFWGSIALPVRAGVDFPLLLVDQYVRQPGVAPPPSNDIRKGVVCRNLELELRWLSLAMRHKLARRNPPIPSFEITRSILGLLDPRGDFDVQVMGDWRPGVYDGFHAVRNAVALGGRFLGRRR